MDYQFSICRGGNLSNGFAGQHQFISPNERAISLYKLREPFSASFSSSLAPIWRNLVLRINDEALPLLSEVNPDLALRIPDQVTFQSDKTEVVSFNTEAPNLGEMFEISIAIVRSIYSRRVDPDFDFYADPENMKLLEGVPGHLQRNIVQAGSYDGAVRVKGRQILHCQMSERIEANSWNHTDQLVFTSVQCLLVVFAMIFARWVSKRLSGRVAAVVYHLIPYIGCSAIYFVFIRLFFLK